MSATDTELSELDALYEQSLKLSPALRLQLSERLILSVPPPGASRTDEEWDAEIERRVREYENDPTRGVPAEEAMQHAAERIEKVRRLQNSG